MIGRRFALFGLLAGNVVACDASGPEMPYTALGSELDALRTAFDADAGHVRLVMLASPT